MTENLIYLHKDLPGMTALPLNAAVHHQTPAGRCGCSARRCPGWVCDGGAPPEAGLKGEMGVFTL